MIIVFNQRKRRILDAAHRLFVEKGFHQTSIQDIVNKAGISKGTFYNYFGSKNECLLAILENVQAEGDQKRIEIGIGNSRQDEDVFIQQIAVRADMNKEYDMLALFEAIHNFDDPDIKNFIKAQYISEVQWISKRISEVYSLESEERSMDHAVMFMGAFQHFMYVWRLGTDMEVELKNMIRFILNRLKPMIQEQARSGEFFFPLNWFGVDTDMLSTHELLSMSVKKINNLMAKADKEQQEYLNFLKNEVQSDEPRKFLIESIILSLTTMFEKMELEHDVRHVVQLVEAFLKNYEMEEGD